MHAPEIHSDALEKLFCQEGNVFPPFTQWRDVQEYRADPEIQIAAKLLLAHQFGEILMAGSD